MNLLRRLRPVDGGIALGAVLGLLLLHYASSGDTAAGVATPDPPAPPKPHFEKTIHWANARKGNLHAHSAWSDGDVVPAEVLSWYRRNGYQFAALTDHNSRVAPEIFAHLEREDFAILPGEELTTLVGGKPVHVNGICTSETIGEVKGATRVEVLSRAIQAVNAQGGISIINHPNFDWTLGAEQLQAGAEGANYIEVLSGHPHVRWEGDETHPSAESLWAGLMDAGIHVGPVAVDDAHHFAARTMREPQALPGAGWVGVFSWGGDTASICDALRAGDLYASMGPVIHEIVVDEDTFSVRVDDPGAYVLFVGTGGEVLAEYPPGPNGVAQYQLSGTEKYVRAHVRGSDGKIALTPAVRVLDGTEPGP